MSKLALVVLSTSLFACATTTGTLDREPTSRAHVHLELGTELDHRAVFPQALAPRLPSVDRIHRDVRARFGDAAIAALELCVAPTGHVTKVALVESSRFAAFDAALVRDAEHWRFAATPGRTASRALQTCRRATVKYVAPR